MVAATLKAIASSVLKQRLLKPKAKVLPEGAAALTGNRRVCDLHWPLSALPIEAADIQGIVFRGYGRLPECCYVLLRMGAPAEARGFVRGLLERVSPGVPAAREVAVQIAFTHAGLAALGLPEGVLRQFSREFIEGMTGEHRSRYLGDECESAPECWQWGGPQSPPVHAVLMLYAETSPRLAQLVEELSRAWRAAGLTEVRTLHTNSRLGGLEHFGFADGISQPAIDGYHPAPSDLHRVRAGEFVLGYENEYGLYTERPLLEAARDPFALLPLDIEGSPRRDLGRNGTYLVFRQLRQDVAAFRRALEELSCRSDGAPDRRVRERLAAQMIGRWPSGASLIEGPYADDSTQARNNEFRYHHEDRQGLKCPLGAHVRRANPRDALAPRPGSERSIAVNHRHRLIRRGRTYGERLPEGQVDDQDRGLVFVAVNANILRQFEFVQHSWLNNPAFNGATGESDPIAGSLKDNQFAAPGDPVRTRYTGLSRFVTVTGGAYFFLPGIAALRFLAQPVDAGA